MVKGLIANISSLLGTSGEVTFGEFAPVIGKALQSLKIMKLKKRLDSCEEKIEIITTKVSTIDDGEFVTLLKDFLFPSILQYLLDEEEDKKTSYFLNGFEFVIDEKLISESKLLIYYDILRGLRAIEIEYLASLSTVYKQYRKKINETEEFLENPFDNEEFYLIISSVESKLEGFGLIKTSRSDSSADTMRRMGQEFNKPRYLRSSLNKNEQAQLTKFGLYFLNMFNILEKYK